MTISKLKSKLQNDLKKLPLPVLQEIEALVNQRLKAKQVSPNIYRKFGALSGMLQHMSLDFNAPLDDFKDYQ